MVPPTHYKPPLPFARIDSMTNLFGPAPLLASSLFLSSQLRLRQVGKVSSSATAEIGGYLASQFALGPDRARIGNLSRRGPIAKDSNPGMETC